MSYCNKCRDEIKNEHKKSSRRCFSFRKWVGQIHDERIRLHGAMLTWKHCSIHWRTLDILGRDVISQWGFHSLSVQKIDSTTAPGAYNWHINNLKRRLVFGCWLKTTDTFTRIYWYMKPCGLNLLGLLLTLMRYIPTNILISVCHSTQRHIAEERCLYQHHCEKSGSFNFNVVPTVHIA